MKILHPAMLWPLLIGLPVGETLAAGRDDPLVTMVELDRLEIAVDEDETPSLLEGQAWLGYDLSKLWLKTEVEREGSHTESADLELLYGRAVSPYWDVQLGWKRDFKPGPTRDWLAIGLQGLAPYYFELDSTLYLGDNGRSSVRIEAEYELLFTQRLILTPELELDFNGYNDPATGTGSGLASTEFGLRLRYEIRRELAPYIGVFWERNYGNTADFTRAEGASISDSRVVLGLHAWF